MISKYSELEIISNSKYFEIISRHILKSKTRDKNINSQNNLKTKTLISKRIFNITCFYQEVSFSSKKFSNSMENSTYSWFWLSSILTSFLLCSSKNLCHNLVQRIAREIVSHLDVVVWAFWKRLAGWKSSSLSVTKRMNEFKINWLPSQSRAMSHFFLWQRRIK